MYMKNIIMSILCNNFHIKNPRGKKSLVQKRTVTNREHKKEPEWFWEKRLQNVKKETTLTLALTTTVSCILSSYMHVWPFKCTSDSR